ncbi:hypothetical protein [Azoarcus sp. CIB]|uniref:hypothetical protein n=1 Tax=Aromatoleum sp. (strain CIB) TaxID=198107 RepID=UPI0012EEB617|nr:hypothetical protein [Azoarcus sp. CIB]
MSIKPLFAIQRRICVKEGAEFDASGRRSLTQDNALLCSHQDKGIGLRKMMNNPWKKLPASAPYVLADDQLYIAVHNARVSHRHGHGHEHWVKLSLLPEPRLGPVNAPVVLLQGNPSLGLPEPPWTEADRRTNLEDEDHDHLGAKLGGKWWTPVLSRLLKDLSPKQVARGLCSVELFPYCSETFGHAHIRLPSQQYTRDVVLQMIERRAIFLVARKYPEWLGLVPELAQLAGTDLFRLKNSRRISISPRNMPDAQLQGRVYTSQAYDRVVDAMWKGASAGGA